MADLTPGTKKPWGGRFTEPTNELVESFTESISFDARLYQQDIDGSIAHSKMLASIGVLSSDEAERLFVNKSSKDNSSGRTSLKMFI